MSGEHLQTAAAGNSDLAETVAKPQVIYRCKKCRRIIASEENIVPHERGKGEQCFKWKKRSNEPGKGEKEAAECSSIFVESMKWMQSCNYELITFSHFFCFFSVTHTHTHTCNRKLS